MMRTILMVLFKRMHIQAVSDIHPFKGAPEKADLEKLQNRT